MRAPGGGAAYADLWADGLEGLCSDLVEIEVLCLCAGPEAAVGLQTVLLHTNTQL